MRNARLPQLVPVLFAAMAALIAPALADDAADEARGDQVTRIDCEVMREGRRMTNVRVSAWQKSREQPVASARMHFVLESLASP